MGRVLLVSLVSIAVLGGEAAAGGRVAVKPKAIEPGARLVLVRHGESQANVDHQMAGKLNVPLTAKGRAQARAVGKALRRFRFDKAYSSTRARARDTLTIALGVAGQRRVPTARRRALDERAFGFMEGMTHEEAATLFGAERLRTWRLSKDEGPPGGETMDEVEHRTVDLLDRELIPQLKAGKTILVASHKHTLRALIGHIEGMTQKQLEALEVTNGDPIVFRLDGKSGRLVREK
jgi:2,3-bisphosphoglycerate-dependent phosphoglycerate mutase